MCGLLGHHKDDETSGECWSCRKDDPGGSCRAVDVPYRCLAPFSTAKKERCSNKQFAGFTTSIGTSSRPLYSGLENMRDQHAMIYKACVIFGSMVAVYVLQPASLSAISSLNSCKICQYHHEYSSTFSKAFVLTLPQYPYRFVVLIMSWASSKTPRLLLPLCSQSCPCVSLQWRLLVCRSRRRQTFTTIRSSSRGC